MGRMLLAAKNTLGASLPRPPGWDLLGTLSAPPAPQPIWDSESSWGTFHSLGPLTLMPVTLGECRELQQRGQEASRSCSPGSASVHRPCSICLAEKVVSATGARAARVTSGPAHLLLFLGFFLFERSRMKQRKERGGAGKGFWWFTAPAHPLPRWLCLIHALQ